MFGSGGGGFGTNNTTFGSSSTPFGGGTGQKQTSTFGSGNSTFGSSTTSTFGSKPTFGSGTTTGGFGSTSNAFGAKPGVFGAPAASPTPAFGSPAAGTSAFGRTTSTSPFGTAQAPSTGAFGSSSTTGGGLFGSTPAPAPGAFGAATPAAGLGAFGSTASSPFSKPVSSPFGAPAAAAPGTGSVFGAAAPSPAPTGGGFGLFGSTSTTGGGLFGSTPAPATGAFGTPAPAAGGGLFGSTTSAFGTGTTAFGVTSQKGTGNPAWRETRTDDTTKSGVNSIGMLMSISAMKEYEGRSHEELRLEDYLQNRKNKSAISAASIGFGTTPAPSTGGLFGGFGTTPAPAPAAGKPFSFTSLSTSAAPAPSGFGGTFGSSTTPAPAAGGFAGFNTSRTPAPATGLFGTTAPAPTPAFGAAAPAPSGGFSFGPSTAGAPAPTSGFGGLFGSSPAPAPTPGIFGAATPAAGASTFGGGFGATSAATAAPTAMSFGSTIGTFGAPTPAPTAGGRFSFGSTVTSGSSTFGAPAPAPAAGGGFGTVGNLFGSTPSPAPGGFSFSQPAPSPAFSSGGGAFSFTSAPKPAAGAFGAPAPSTGIFGSSAPAAGTLGSSIFGAPTPAPASIGFGGFGSGAGSSVPAPAPSSVFGAPATAPAAGGLFGTQQQQQQRVAIHNQNPYGAADNAGFGSGALERKIKGVENSSNQLSIRFERDGNSSGVGAGGQSGSSGQANPPLGFTYRRTSKPASGIQPRGLPTGAGGGAAEGSSANFPVIVSSLRMAEGTLAPNRKSGVLSPDVYLSRGMKHLNLPSNADNREKVSATETESATADKAEAEADAKMVAAAIKPLLKSKSDDKLGVDDQGGQRLPLEDEKEEKYYDDGGVEETKGEWPSAAAESKATESNNYEDRKGKNEEKVESVASPDGGGSRRRNARGAVGFISPPPSGGGKGTDVRAAATGESTTAASPADHRTVNDHGGGSGGRLFVDGGGDFGGASSGPPTLDIEGYTTKPPISELATMDSDALRVVSGFEVERAGFGKIAWKEPVDLRGVDIGEVVKIEYRGVSVYDDLPPGQEKPVRGTGLNNPTRVTLYSVFPRGDDPTDEQKRRYEAKVRKITDKMGANFVGYDVELGIWEFETFHWSRYAMEDSEDDEDYDEKSKDKKKGRGNGANNMPPPPPRNPAAVRSRKPTPSKGERKQSGTRGTKYYMPDTDEEGSAAENASDDKGPKMTSRMFRSGGFDVNDINKKDHDRYRAGPENEDVAMADAETTARSNGEGGGRGDGSYASMKSRFTTDDILPLNEPSKQEYLRFHLLDDGKITNEGAGHHLSSSTKTSPRAPQTLPLPSWLPSRLPKRLALRNPEDAEAAKNFRPLLDDSESRVLRLLAKAWEPVSGELEDEGARGMLRAGRMAADLGLRMGRGFRASWGPGGQLVFPGAIGGGKTPRRHAVRVVRFDPIPSAHGRDVETLYVDPLRNHLRFAQPRLEEGWNAPCWTLPIRRNDQRENYDDLVRCMHGYSAVHAAAGVKCSRSGFGGGKASEDGPEWVLEQLWRLANAMWGQEEGDGRAQDLPVPGDVHVPVSAGGGDGASPAVRREAAVAEWVANAVSSCLPAADEKGQGTWRRILELLSVRQVKGAAEVAMDAGLPRLAVALTAAATQGIGRPVKQGASKFLAQQASLWQGSGADSRMPLEAFIVYQLLGREGFRDVRLRGVIGERSHSLHPSLDWLRQFGLCLWFGAGARAGSVCVGGGAVDAAVKAYESLVTDNEALAPTARYFREPTHHDKADLDQVCRELRRVHVGDSTAMFGGTTGCGRDRCVLNRLLAIYPSRVTGSVASGVALLAALEPMAVTPDVMDYRHSWHLMNVVEALGVAEVPDRSKVAAIAEGLRFQLVSAGLWEWAVYVSLAAEGDADRREATARELVLRHGYGLLDAPAGSLDEKRRLLLHELHVPAPWLYEAAATRAGYEHKSALPAPVPGAQADVPTPFEAGARAEQLRETKLKFLVSAESSGLGGDAVTEACTLAPGSLYLGGSARKRLTEYFEKISMQLAEERVVRRTCNGRATDVDPRSKEFDAYKEILEVAEEGTTPERWTKDQVERFERLRGVVEPAVTHILGATVAHEAFDTLWEEAGILVV